MLSVVCVLIEWIENFISRRPDILMGFSKLLKRAEFRHILDIFGCADIITLSRDLTLP